MAQCPPNTLLHVVTDTSIRFLSQLSKDLMNAIVMRVKVTMKQQYSAVHHGDIPA